MIDYATSISYSAKSEQLLSGAYETRKQIPYINNQNEDIQDEPDNIFYKGLNTVMAQSNPKRPGILFKKRQSNIG